MITVRTPPNARYFIDHDISKVARHINYSFFLNLKNMIKIIFIYIIYNKKTIYCIDIYII